MKYDNILVNIFITKYNTISPKLHYIFKNKNNYDKRYPNIKQYIALRYNDSFSYQETIRRMQHHIDKHPTCPMCGKPVAFVGKTAKLFGKYCSDSCRGKDPVNNTKWKEGQYKYNLKHYGVKHNFEIDKCKNKRIKTLINKYNTTGILAVPSIKEKFNKTIYEKYNTKFNSF